MTSLEGTRPIPVHLLRYQRAGLWDEVTVITMARRWAEAAPERIAISAGNQTRTYGDLVHDAELLAGALEELGLNEGDVVSVQMPNWPEAAVINLACALGGFVINPIVPIYRDAEVGHMLESAKTRAFFTPAIFNGVNYGEMVARLRSRLPDVHHITVRHEDGECNLQKLLMGAPARRRSGRDTDPNAIKMLLYTSGTTGRPKGVLHSHNTLTRVAQQCLSHWGVNPEDGILMPSPVTHISGFVFGLEFPFIGGTHTVLMEKWNATEAVDLIHKHQIVGTVAATPFLKELTTDAGDAAGKLASMRFFGCGGAAVPPETIREANRAFGRTVAFRVFGSSEVPMVTLGYPHDPDLAAVTDGEPIDYEIRIVDAEGRDCEPGCEGEVIARGPSMLAGYANPEETAAAVDADGFFHTGDVGRLLPNGGLVITGRKKDLIIRGGENISPKEIEDVLDTHPLVRESAVVAMPHPRLGEGICAFVIPAPGAEPSIDELKAFVLEAGLAKQKQPERLELVADLPRTPSGKVRKDLLRASLQDSLVEVPGRTGDR